IGNMVGTGIFTSLGFQVGDLPSGFALMVLWAIGGVCAMGGGRSFAASGGAARCVGHCPMLNSEPPCLGPEVNTISWAGSIIHQSVSWPAGFPQQSASLRRWPSQLNRSARTLPISCLGQVRFYFLSAWFGLPPWF